MKDDTKIIITIVIYNIVVVLAMCWLFYITRSAWAFLLLLALLRATSKKDDDEVKDE